MWNTVYCILLALSLAICVHCQVAVTETYAHSATLTSGNIKLYWKFTETHITFEVHGQTEGWIGIGFSPNGAMTGADIFVGWVKDGNVTVTDRHGTSNNYPPLDNEQNIEVLAGTEQGGWTMFKFSRQLAACESQYDREITSSTQRFIWAFGTTDPTGEDIAVENYHEMNRGVESMYFLESPDSPPFDLPVGPEYKTFDIKMDEFQVPAVDTYYNCKLFKLPDFTEKNHIVKVVPIIQAGNELAVHHMLFYRCGDVSKYGLELGVDEPCSNPNIFKTCSPVMISWGIGGTGTIFPKEAGLSVGAADDPVVVLLEIHYDNPTMKTNIIDSSGFRFTYTNTIRKYDTGILTIGKNSNGKSLFIPPGAESYLSVGLCEKRCLEKRMNASGRTNVTVFNVFLHTHLAGRQLTLRHFRNGTELPYISYDLNYEFNYQESRSIVPPVIVQSTDTLRMDCVYNTKGYTGMVEGGESTRQEMCLAFASYYPKIDIGLCLSSAVTDQSWYYFGIEEANHTGIGNSLKDFTVTKPDSLKGKTVYQVMSEYNWTEASIDKFSEDYLTMRQQQLCRPGNRSQAERFYFFHPNITSEYTLPTMTCSEPTRATGITTTSSAPSIASRGLAIKLLGMFLALIFRIQ